VPFAGINNLGPAATAAGFPIDCPQVVTENELATARILISPERVVGFVTVTEVIAYRVPEGSGTVLLPVLTMNGAVGGIVNALAGNVTTTGTASEDELVTVTGADGLLPCANEEIELAPSSSTANTLDPAIPIEFIEKLPSLVWAAMFIFALVFCQRRERVVTAARQICVPNTMSLPRFTPPPPASSL
jgi:hypothetical protein